MQRKAKIGTCLLIAVWAAGLLAQPEFARPKAARSGKQKFTAAGTASAAASPVPQPEASKVILVLETRNHRVTVRSSVEELNYSVANLQGFALAERLSVNELKDRFPELHEIVTGTAWAGIHPRGR